jgi:hypothetical protein
MTNKKNVSTSPRPALSTFATLFGLGGWIAVSACTATADHPSGVGDHPSSDDGGRETSSGSSGSSGSGGSGGGSGSGGSSGGSGDDGSTLDGGAADAAPSDATLVSDVRTTPPGDAAMTDPTCNPTMTWGAPSNVPGVPGFAAQPLITITNDELTVAWVVDNGGGQGNVFVADRASTSASFGSATQLVEMPAGGSVVDSAVADGGSSYFAFDRVALSSDGLTLVGVALSGLHMAQFIRANRTSAFVSMPMETRYNVLASALMAGEKLGDPVLAANGEDFVYSRYGLSPSLTIYESFLTAGQTWPAGSGESAAALEEDAGRRKHPTSMTADRLTLFVWDEAGEAYGVIRSTQTSNFNYPIPFGPRFSIQINGACSRIYYVAPAASGYSVVQADAQ